MYYERVEDAAIHAQVQGVENVLVETTIHFLELLPNQFLLPNYTSSGEYGETVASGGICRHS